ncbi:hypothetical protein CVM73_13860 [Bradyrhizobium forestalis]|uniref:Uncharacterized protein n=1 Tax=Bradyrhizobium forestalis TaxID=1419263 RepID=A0A2M8RA72_9BRAD|nr:hypothetical protein CVM73_13860 [Bradyrhizobium forestalis]
MSMRQDTLEARRACQLITAGPAAIVDLDQAPNTDLPVGTGVAGKAGAAVDILSMARLRP